MRKDFSHPEPALQVQAFQESRRSAAHYQGFIPAFQNQDTGETHLSLTAEGNLAPVHLLEGLPAHWVVERDASGRVCIIKAGIVAGFMRDGHFYTRQQLAARPFDA